jgi:hypothetical protein
MLVRRVSNTGGSRKNEVSFVVIASTTAVTSGSDGPLARRRPTRPDSPATPSDRASGSSRDSTRYCLESSSTIAARSATSLRMKSKSELAPTPRFAPASVMGGSRRVVAGLRCRPGC